MLRIELNRGWCVLVSVLGECSQSPAFDSEHSPNALKIRQFAYWFCAISGFESVKKPWFKLYAQDTLMDSKLDGIPLEAHGLILKMWCLCHIEGRCPADPVELARKLRCPLPYVSQYQSLCESLFERHNGSLVSKRMERERRLSEINSNNAKKGHKGFAERSAERFAVPLSDSDYDSDFDLDSGFDSRSKPR